MKKSKRIVLPALVTVLALLAGGGIRGAFAYDRTELTYKPIMVLDSLTRKTTETDTPALKTQKTGDVELMIPSLTLNYSDTTANMLGTGNSGGFYNAASSTNASLDYLAVKYTATSGVKPEHLSVNMYLNTSTPRIAGNATTWKSLATEAYAPGELTPGITLTTDGSDAVILIDITETYGLTAYAGYLDRLYIGFNADSTVASAQRFTVKEIYTTDVATSDGYNATYGDKMYDNFSSSYWGTSGTDYYQRQRNTTNTVLNELMLQMRHDDGAPAAYTVTSETYSNVETAYRYVGIQARASAAGNAGNFTIAAVKADGTLSPAVVWSGVTLRTGTVGLTTSFVEYVVDIDTTFGTSAVRGFQFATTGPDAFTLSLRTIRYGTMDMAPYKFTDEEIDIEIDQSTIEHIDFDWETYGGWWYNPSTKTDISIEPDGAGKALTLTTTDTARRYIEFAAPTIESSSAGKQYLVMTMKGNCNDFVRVNLRSDASTSNWLYLSNLYKAPGISCGRLDPDEYKTFIIDLKANATSYMGLTRWVIAGTTGFGLEINNMPADTTGSFSLSLKELYFANAVDTTTPVTTGTTVYVNTDQSARFMFENNADTFTEVWGGGITAADYTYENGLLTIKQSFIKSLGAGEYTFNVAFDIAGTIELTVVVEAAPEAEQPAPYSYPAITAYVNTAQSARFAIVGGGSLISLTGHNITDANYTYENGLLTISQDFIKSLGEGSYTFTGTFADAGVITLIVKAEKAPSSSGGCKGSSSAVVTLLGGLLVCVIAGRKFF